jgi:hypothetical protein
MAPIQAPLARFALNRSRFNAAPDKCVAPANGNGWQKAVLISLEAQQ